MLNEVAQGIGYLGEDGEHIDVADFLREQGFDVKIQKDSDVHVKYYLSVNGHTIGRAYLYNNGAELNIVGFRTQYQNPNPEDFEHVGHGKRALRAIFNFAIQAGHYDEITTSVFARTGTGFFLSQGFYNRKPRSVAKGSQQRIWHKDDLSINWERAKSQFSKKDIEQARARLGDESDDNRIFKLARTPIGKIVLWNCGSCGYADLKDDNQMNRIQAVVGLDR